jgi:hypothetical protein
MGVEKVRMRVEVMIRLKVDISPVRMASKTWPSARVRGP